MSTKTNITGSGFLAAGSASLVGIKTQGVTVLQRSGFVTISIAAAERFAMRCMEIEGEPARNTTEQFDLKQYCSSVVVMSAASIEAFKNELLLDRVSEPLKLTKDKAEKLITGGKGAPKGWPEPLHVVDAFLRYKAKAGLDFAKSALDENARALFYARNALMHYWPEWHGQEVSHKRTSELLEPRFPPNPFADPNQSFFPERCMGFGFAKWAFMTATDFILSVQTRAGINAGYSVNTFRTDGRW